MIMRRLMLLVAFTTTGLGSIQAQEPKTKPEAPKPKADDVKSIDAIVAALYDVISGPQGQARDWDRFRSLFTADARLIPVIVGRDGATKAASFSADQYVVMSSPAFAKQGFFEAEVSRKVETFGAIAHVFSTYESRKAKDEKPFARGINSIQLVKQGERWYIVTVLWDAERSGLTIPADYLPKK
jgi:hypothetical protein